jgi:hypothetical protein
LRLGAQEKLVRNAGGKCVRGCRGEQDQLAGREVGQRIRQVGEWADAEADFRQWPATLAQRPTSTSRLPSTP